MIKEIALALIIVCLAVFQASFLARLGDLGYILSPVFLAIFLVNYFENIEKKTGLWLAVLAGFLMDIVSGTLLGVLTLVFFLVAFLVKKLSFCLDAKNVYSFLFSLTVSFAGYVFLCFGFLFLIDLFL